MKEKIKEKLISCREKITLSSIIILILVSLISLIYADFPGRITILLFDFMVIILFYQYRIILEKNSENELQIQKLEAERASVEENAMNMAIGVSHLFEVTNKIKEKDLSVRADENLLQDELIRNLGCEINKMLESLSNMTSQIQSESQTTASSIEEMATTINEVAADANRVSDEADKAKQEAVQGGDSVSKVIIGMGDIAKSVERLVDVIERLGKRGEHIGEIVKSISGIADQTNLLALNAAIEAARAGEAGKGFAVVADEVRKLAENAASSAQEIGELINTIQDETKFAVQRAGESVDRVKEGENLAKIAGEAMARIINNVDNVADLINQITSATVEQSAGTQQIVKSIHQLASLADEISKEKE